jgi:hypothetical protein
VAEVDDLLVEYAKFVANPWRADLAGPQRVWMVVYSPNQERRIRYRLDEFALATKQAGHTWEVLDLTDSFPAWLGAQEYREGYFADPGALTIAVGDFVDSVVAEVVDVLETSAEDEVVAVLGTGALYPYCRVSEVIEAVNGSIPGRLVVFFPGEYSDNVYRLLNARDGWNYMAVPITAR